MKCIKYIILFAASLLPLQSKLYAGWIKQIADAYHVDCGGTSISIDSNNYPHIVYFNIYDDDLKYIKWTGSSWNKEVVGASITYYPHLSLDLDSNNYPHISYRDGIIDYLKYARWTGSSWSIETVDSSGDVGQYSSIAVDLNNYPHISYEDTRNDCLKYARWTGSSWAIETVDSIGNVGRYSAIAVDLSNYPHISYYDSTNGNLKYARWTGSSWAIETVDSIGNVGMFTSIALDTNNYPHISYYDSTNGNLKYARWTDSSWLVETVNPAGNVGEYSAIAVDLSNYPHISYYDSTNGNLKYAKWTGSSWSIEIVDSISTPDEEISIAIDSNDRPHISYDGTGSYLYHTFKNNNPILSWVGGINYIAAGLHPVTGTSTTTFVYKIEYTDTDNDAPKSGYPKVHITKAGIEIDGSPFTMSADFPDDTNYANGKIYSYLTTLSSGTDFTYYFEGYDVWNASATGSPTITINAPDVFVLPKINILKETLYFCAVEGGSSPSNQKFTISNTGASVSTLIWSASDDKSWLDFTPSSGTVSYGSSTTVTVFLDISSLSTGTYNGTIIVSDPNATNSPQTVLVTLAITSEPKPTITLSKTSLTFSATEGGSNPSEQVFTISNSGASGSILNWSTSIDKTWLSISQTTGSITSENLDTVDVSVDISNLSIGIYSSTITISDPDATNNPNIILLILDIISEPKPTITLSKTSLTFSAIEGGNNPDNQTFTISNLGDSSSTLSWSASDDMNWLSFTPTSGIISYGASDIVTVSADISGLTGGTYNGIITVSDPNAINSTQTVTVELDINRVPILSWIGDANYEFDGLHPEIGVTTTTFVFKVKYTDEDNNSPAASYPKVHIIKGNIEISGGPMEELHQGDINYIDGKCYLYSTTLMEGSDYNYYFEAYDSKYSEATGSPTVSINSPDVTTSGITNYSISGYVKNSDGSGIADIIISLSGNKTDSDFTDKNGYYEFTSLTEGGNYTVKPTKKHYWFFPRSSISTTSLSGNIDNLNFVGCIQPYSISGQIVDKNDNTTPLKGIKLALSGDKSETTFTDTNGCYSFTGLSAYGNFIVTPENDNYVFNPSSYSYSSLETNAWGANFKGEYVGTGGIISGTVKDRKWQGVSGVTVTLYNDTFSTTSVTGSDGIYVFSNLSKEDYTVIPSKEGYFFDPEKGECTVGGGTNFKAANRDDLIQLIDELATDTTNVLEHETDFLAEILAEISQMQLYEDLIKVHSGLWKKLTDTADVAYCLTNPIYLIYKTIFDQYSMMEIAEIQDAFLRSAFKECNDKESWKECLNEGKPIWSPDKSYEIYGVNKLKTSMLELISAMKSENIIPGKDELSAGYPMWDLIELLIKFKSAIKNSKNTEDFIFNFDFGSSPNKTYFEQISSLEESYSSNFSEIKKYINNPLYLVEMHIRYIPIFIKGFTVIKVTIAAGTFEVGGGTLLGTLPMQAYAALGAELTTKVTERLISKNIRPEDAISFFVGLGDVQFNQKWQVIWFQIAKLKLAILKMQYQNIGETVKKNTEAIEIKSFNMENTFGINLDNVQPVEGEIVVKNNSSENLTVNVCGKVYVNGESPPIDYPVDLFSIDPVVISAGEQKTISINFQQFVNRIYGEDTKYRAYAYVIPELGFPKVSAPSIYKVGNEFTSSDYISLTPISGTIDQNSAIQKEYTTQSDTYKADFNLTYSGSDLDIHVYDESGSHTGINYGNNIVEFNVPNSTYTYGSNSESITIKNAGGKKYCIVVNAKDASLWENYSVTVTERARIKALLAPRESKIDKPVTSNQMYFYPVWGEAGGDNDLKNVWFSPEDLIEENNPGNRISENNISIEPVYVNEIPAGTNIGTKVTVSIPAGLPPGKYKGDILAQGIDVYTGETSTHSIRLTLRINNVPDARIYPNPYIPYDGNYDTGKPYSSGDTTSGIIFDQLPQKVEIRIYKITGEKVRSFSTDSSGGKVQWDVKDDNIKDVTSGGYIYVIKSDKEVKKGKLAIIR